MREPAPPPAETHIFTADHLAVELLAAGLASPAEVFGAGVSLPIDEASRLRLAKAGPDLIARAKLGRFADEGRTTIELTNAGRYWAIDGGWMAFLKEPPPDGGGGGRNRDPSTEALRSEFMRLRLRTFWWSFGLSAAGFILSIISMVIAIMFGNKMLP